MAATLVLLSLLCIGGTIVVVRRRILNTSSTLLLSDLLSHLTFTNTHSNMEMETAIPQPHHTIVDPSTNHTSVIDASHLAKNVIFHHLILEIHAIEIVAALAIFVAFHSFCQAKTRGLLVWPVVRMMPSLSPAPAAAASTVSSPPTPVTLSSYSRTNSPTSPRGPSSCSTVRDLLGDGIFNAADESWWRQRKTASIEFHSAKFCAMTPESLVELVHARLLVLEGAVSTAEVL